MELIDKLLKARKENELPEKVYIVFRQLYETYANSLISAGFDMKNYDHIFETLLVLVKNQIKDPYPFEPFHKRITSPFNYYQFGLDFLRPLVDMEKTKVAHLANVKKMVEQIHAKENVILFANHQTEVDPQLISVVLEKKYPDFAKEVIFVAGDRVITDPLAVPFSMGRNLLCIYSKRHIDIPPEKKEEKLKHNQRTMKRMKELLSEGGQCIYVAPSGGRDRPSPNGEVMVAPFDPQSIEMFRLMAKQAETPTHFYPLALVTFDILPPPRTIESELGEARCIKREGALFSFGKEIDMEIFPGSDLNDKQAKRIARSMYIWNLVKSEYSLLKQGVINE